MFQEAFATLQVPRPRISARRYGELDEATVAKQPDELRWTNLVRRDLGDQVCHWTRPARGRSAFEILKSMLGDRAIRGGTGYIMGSHQCVCFTEAPVSEVIPYFRLARANKVSLKYQPYGIAVRKGWLFEKGGRPVIYQHQNEYPSLPKALQWRHCSYDPVNGPDFTWEREWRLRTATLNLDPKHCLVIVPTVAEAFEVMTEGTTPDSGPRWLAVSLSFLGL